jgi:type II secretory pathway predicted ATPase ExeA
MPQGSDLQAMFLSYYKLAEQPFGVTPDPRFLYLGPKHREALASLIYGTESNRGFLALIAKPGMGKTSLLYHYLDYLRDKARTAFVFRTDCDSREFIRHVLLDLGIESSGMDLPSMHDTLNRVLTDEMNAGRRFVLVIDEAQGLEETVLESIRLLSNFETLWMKLMQIVLAGQTQLADHLASASMAQLRQRVSMVIRVEPFTIDEVNSYIDHRLRVAGCETPSLFTVDARKLIAEHSEGIPRNINNLCFNGLSLGYALKQRTIDRAIILEVIADLDLDSLIEKRPALTGACEEVPIQVTSTPEPPTERRELAFRGWVPKFAIAGALVLAVATGVNKGEVDPVNPAGRTDSQVVQQFPVPAQIPANPEATDLSPKQEPRSVRISHGQTRHQTSVEDLGRYDPQVLLEGIRDPDAWLSDPGHIRAGQRILITSAPMSPAGGQSTVPQEGPSTPPEVGKE